MQLLGVAKPEVSGKKPEIGNVVRYVPGEHYAHIKDYRCNEYCWEWHWLWEQRSEWKVLTHDALDTKLAEIRGLRDSHDLGQDRKRLLRKARPIKHFRATVAQVFEDGTIEVHCQDMFMQGVTQGEVRVPQGPNDGSKPHTWFWPLDTESDQKIDLKEGDA